MKTRWKFLAALLLAGSSAGFYGSPAQAQVYTEDPAADAGETLPTAASTATGTAGAPLTSIQGSFASGTDADLFAIQIATVSSFSATTVNTLTSLAGLDTELFLFDANGAPVAVNDDASGTQLASTLPVGSAFFSSLTPGLYYVGISLSGNEPVNAIGQLLFAADGGDSTTVRGAASGLSLSAEAMFNDDEFYAQTGNYEIDLTGSETAFNPIAVPEPSSWAALTLGGLAAAACIYRHRRAV